MNFGEGKIASKLFNLYVVLLVGIAVFVYLNPVEKKNTLYEINQETH